MIELESSLSYSLPLDVGQGGLFESFWTRNTTLQSMVFRVTRFGVTKWRVGTERDIPIDDRISSTDRLSILRRLTTPASTDRLVCELKVLLATDRCLRYEENNVEIGVQLVDNLRYPLMLEDRLSVEMSDATSNAVSNVIEHLSMSEDETSDNNLGISFIHRLSFFERVDDDHVVRVSLRASLNDFHEIAYSLELECEENVDNVESIYRRARRHDALIHVWRLVALPLMRQYWSIGLRFDTIPYDVPKEIISDMDATTRLWHVTTGPSFYTRDAMFDRIKSVTQTSDRDEVIAKIKYDGARDFAWFRDIDALTISGTRVSLTRGDVFSGMFVYQVERLKSADETMETIVTEVHCVINPRLLMSVTGGGALQRQMDYCGHSRASEQVDVITAHTLASPIAKNASVNAFDAWPILFEVLSEKLIVHALRIFIRCSNCCKGSYSAPSERCFYTNCGDGVARTVGRDTINGLIVSECGRHILRENTVRHITGSNGDLFTDWRDFTLFTRTLIVIRPEVSNAILRDMCIAANGCIVGDSVTLSLPFRVNIETERIVLQSLLDKTLPHRYDGLLLLTKESSDQSVKYTKIKMHQTVELGISWDNAILHSRDNFYFAKRISINTAKTMLYRVCVPGIGVLIVCGLRNMPRNRCKDFTIAEFAHIRPNVLRYVRCRDKHFPDTTAKAICIIVNKR